MTQVVNIRSEEPTVYIGRAGQGKDGYFGNPVVRGQSCPECGEIHQKAEETLPCYKTYLWRRVNEDATFRRKLWALKNETLGCFCKPEACHGDVIVAWLEAGGPYRKNGKKRSMAEDTGIKQAAARAGAEEINLCGGPVHEVGGMWSIYDETDYFIVTTNAFVKNNGELVMGRGIAKEARDRFPSLAKRFGDTIKMLGDPYHLILYVDQKLGAFQVKRHFADQADLDLIRGSVLALRSFARKHPDRRFDLNYPGVGNGRLDREDVEPLVRMLPSNVHVWTKE